VALILSAIFNKLSLSIVADEGISSVYYYNICSVFKIAEPMLAIVKQFFIYFTISTRLVFFSLFRGSPQKLG